MTCSVIPFQLVPVLQSTQGKQKRHDACRCVYDDDLSILAPRQEEGRRMQLLSRALCQDPAHVKVGAAQPPMSIVMRKVI